MIYKHSKGYDFLKRYVNFIHSLFYKNIYVEGLENIPDNKPVIIAPNHQNALMDPMAILLSIKQQPVFLARADIFKSAINRPILRFLKILPVYRVRDGLKSLENNDITFEKSSKVLESKNILSLFPEARHHGHHYLLPLKKGIPRIAFLTEDKNNFELDLKIIPAGIHYGDYYTANSDLWIRFGDPISVKDFKDNYQENPQKAQLQLRDRIADGIRSLILSIEDQENYESLMLIAKIASKSIKATGQKLLENCKKTIEEINFLPKKSKEQLINSSLELRNEIKSQNLEYSDLDLTNFRTGKALLKLFATLPIFLIGIIPSLPHLIIPWFLYRNLKDRQFESSYKFAFFLILSPISNLIFSFYALPKVFDANFFIAVGSFFILFYIQSYIYNYLKTFSNLKRKLTIKQKLRLLSPKIEELKNLLIKFKIMQGAL